VAAYTVEMSIPIPPRPRRGRGPAYPWGEMNVGASFFVPLARGKFSAHYARMKASPGNGTYEIRRVVEDGVRGVRVWRVK